MKDSCHSCLSRAIITAAVAVIGMASFRSLLAAERVACQEMGGRTICRVDEPDVKRPSKDYPSVRFRPGDRVTVTAGGCVQTGGSGDTWKRYVNPSGPNSDRLYHGRCWIPGATAGLQRLIGIVGRPVVIAAGIPETELYLRLGYEDDDYGDNGYWGHDDGTENQCRGVGNAFLVIEIEHQTVDPGLSGMAPFDVEPDSWDDNFLPKNPKWHAQRVPPGAAPDPIALGDGFPYRNPIAPQLGVSFGNPRCTTQEPWIDYGATGKGFFCSFGGEPGRLKGHVNWTAATYEGTMFWSDHSSGLFGDDDYNFSFFPDDLAGLTAGRDHFGVEFDSDETIDHFTQQWWTDFHDAVDNDEGRARAMVDGKRALVLGLLGLDCEHGCHPELHPVYALAINTQSDPNDDRWAIFVRNWGNEGACSQDQQYLGLQTLRIRLPQRGAQLVSVRKAEFFGNYAFTYNIESTSAGLVVTFNLRTNVGSKQSAPPMRVMSLATRVFAVVDLAPTGTPDES